MKRHNIENRKQKNRKQNKFKQENKKTKAGGKVMKTTNNVQKAILKSLAVVVSLVLISFTVSAQGFWETLLENNTFNEIALAMVETGSESEATTETDTEMDADAFAYLLEEEAEEPLELEDWMTNDANFASTFTIETEVDEPMEVEDWMTNETYFDVTSSDFDSNEDMDRLEWIEELKKINANQSDNEVIIKGDYIIGKNFIYLNVDEKEKELQLEPWMVNSKLWRN